MVYHTHQYHVANKHTSLVLAIMVYILVLSSLCMGRETRFM